MRDILPLPCAVKGGDADGFKLKTFLGHQCDLHPHVGAHEQHLRARLALLKKVRAALNPGGRVVVQEFAIDASRTKPPQAALFSVNMLVNTPGGRCYAPGEIKGWLKEAGYRGIKAERFEEAVLITGGK